MFDSETQGLKPLMILIMNIEKKVSKEEETSRECSDMFKNKTTQQRIL